MRLITVAIHTYEKALAVRQMLEAEGIHVTFQNVNLEQPEVSSGVRIRIDEADLPLALRIIEHPEIFSATHHSPDEQSLDKPHRVIVPVDFSSHSFMAAQVAVRIAAAHRVELMFLNSYIDPHVTSNVQLTDNLTYEIADTNTVEHLQEESRHRLDEFTGRLKDMMKAGTLPVVKFSKAVVEGVPEDAIIEYTKSEPPYLVVMGTRQASKKERDMIGSVTAEVLDACRFSVLTIPENIGEWNCRAPRNILFLSNLDQEDILAMDTLYRVFPEATAKVAIVHVPARHRFADRTAGNSALALSDYCSKHFNHYSFHTVPLSPKTAISELAELQRDEAFDLIVVPNRRKNAFSRLFNPGLAHKILFQADIPMLVIPV